MSNRKDIRTPVGRLVQGSLYDGRTTDAEGNALTFKSGPKVGQARMDYFFSIAIPKGPEAHWKDTPWGTIIWSVGQAGFPQGHANSPSFAWKVKDGDDTTPNRNNRKNCDREGFPGHWILNFSSSNPPSIFNRDGSKPLLEKDAVKPGDYIQVFGNVTDNESTQQPGVYLNHQMVAHSGYGEPIILGPDPKAVGFGEDPLPPGASETPVGTAFGATPEPATPAPAPAAPAPAPAAPAPAPAAPAPAPAPAPAAPAPAAPPAPYPEIMNPPAVPARVMTAKAQGTPYEAFIQNGWTDELLIREGMMNP